jgi:hypothetical protein
LPRERQIGRHRLHFLSCARPSANENEVELP